MKEEAVVARKGPFGVVVEKGKTYWWCDHHKLYQMHKTADCRMAAKQTKKRDEKPKLKITDRIKAMVAVDEDYDL